MISFPFFSGPWGKRSEQFVFLLLVLISTLPIFFSPFFPFMDSPAHLYNAGVMRHLLSSDGAFYREFFTFNPILVPNWISSFMLALLEYGMSPLAAEKCFLLSYFIGLPLAMRYCIQCISPGKGYMALLVLPLVYNTLSLYAFYNFSFAILLFLCCTGYFYRHIAWAEPRLKHFLVLFLFLTLIYFSHPVILCITLFILGLLHIHQHYRTYGFSPKRWMNDKTLNCIIAVLPSVILFLLYLRAPKTGKPVYHFLSAGDLFQGVLTGNVFAAFGKNELFTSGILSMLICAVFFILVYRLLSGSWQTIATSKTFFLLPAILVVLLLYRFMPDSDGMGGFVSIRLCILLFLLALLFISVSPWPKPFVILILTLVTGIQLYRARLYHKEMQSRMPQIAAFFNQAKDIQPGSFLYSMAANDDWLAKHYHHYLCINQECIPLQNYECQTGYFPLLWKDASRIDRIIANAGNFINSADLKKDLQNHPLYYWILGDPALKTDPGTQKLMHIMAEQCTLISHTRFSSLYRLK
ncbi:MAG TPA: hypothetical protein VNZ86_00690 [Bacteroidia bacterium]|jgi:hypothetical protein|nr:hypothetical protein [Bacteroidia bacterium]